MRLNLQSRVAVLCAALLFWQAGLAPLAHASAAHGAAHGMVAPELPEPPAAADVEAMPCHGHDTAEPGVSRHHSVHAGEKGSPLAAELPPNTNHGPDCCQTLDCQCPCAHASLASVAVPVLSRRVPDHPIVLGGELPALRARVAQLFKPPI